MLLNHFKYIVVDDAHGISKAIVCHYVKKLPETIFFTSGLANIFNNNSLPRIKKLLVSHRTTKIKT